MIDDSLFYMDNRRNIFQFIGLKSQNSSTLLLLMLLSADFVFGILDMIYQSNATIMRSSLFDIGMDLGYGEVYQYIKYFWIIILLTYIMFSTKCFNYFSWILTFIFFLCDDSLQLHERLGEFAARSFHFNPSLNLRLQDFGELFVEVVIGIFLLTILVFAYLQGSRLFKKISEDLALFAAILVFCGVFLDMLDIGVKAGWVVQETLGLLEDGGEMVAVSFILWYVFNLASQKGNSEMFLYDYIFKSRKTTEI